MMQDPFPGIKFDSSLQELAKRFGLENIRHHAPSGSVHIEMPLNDGGMQRITLAWQQAKYLAFHPELCAEDFLNPKLPADWPCNTET